MKFFAVLLLAVCAIGVNSKLLKHPKEVSHFSPEQMVSYLKHIGTVSHSSRSGATDWQCYSHYYPSLEAIPKRVKAETEACNAVFATDVAKVDGELVSAKQSADQETQDIQQKVITCNALTDPEESLRCHQSNNINYEPLLRSVSNHASQALRDHAGQIQVLEHKNDNCHVVAVNKGEADSQAIYNDLYWCMDNNGEIRPTAEPTIIPTTIPTTTPAVTVPTVPGNEDHFPAEQDPEEDLSGM